MKFEYDGKEDARECVAYIDRDGGMCIKVEETHIDSELVCIDTDGFFRFDLSWNPSYTGVKKRFYPGDKITITF